MCRTVEHLVDESRLDDLAAIEDVNALDDLTYEFVYTGYGAFWFNQPWATKIQRAA